jgi:hypothetical protein
MHSAFGFAQERQMRPESLEYTNLELPIHLSIVFPRWLTR